MQKKELRTAIRRLRLTPSEAENWDAAAKADGKTVSDWLRSKVGDANSFKKRSLRVVVSDPDLVRQVAKIGNNLNQIARAVNQCAQYGTVIQTIELIALLTSIQQEIKDLVREKKECISSSLRMDAEAEKAPQVM